MKCGKYDCGWCFDKSGKNNSADGACMFPEQCDLNMRSVEVFKQYTFSFRCPMCRRENYYEQTVTRNEIVKCDCGERLLVSEVSEI